MLAWALNLGFAAGAAANLKVVCTLVDRNGANLPNLTSLSWAWFDDVDPVDFVAPTDQGEVESTDSSAELVITLPNTALSATQEGTLVLRNDAGTTLGAYNLAVEAM